MHKNRNRFKDVISKPNFNQKPFDDAAEAVEQVKIIYDANTEYLRRGYAAVIGGKQIPGRISACYPQALIEVPVENLRYHKIDRRLSYGFVSKEGTHTTTLTRPDLFGKYYERMLGAVMENHQVPVKVGVSRSPIPIPYAFPDALPKSDKLSEEEKEIIKTKFDFVRLGQIDNHIVNYTSRFFIEKNKDLPLALYTAARVDLSLRRLSYYTGTDPKDFQKFVLFTNYQYYVDEFCNLARELCEDKNSGYTGLVEPKNRNNTDEDITTFGKKEKRKPPQMPAHHLKRADGSGITVVNIGVGPSNAKNITDHIAPLRPDAWIMVGHCGALRKEMKRGSYVLAQGYVREDGILDKKLSTDNTFTAISEIHQALQQAIYDVTGREVDQDVMRSGIVLTVADRNWELDGEKEIYSAIDQNCAIAVDMESATVAANGFLNRVPFGTCLLVSDNPADASPKTSGQEEKLYLERVNQHIRIGVKTIDILRQNPEKSRSRKLLRIHEPAFL